jgi:phosphatidylglycerophosphate synthase
MTRVQSAPISIAAAGAALGSALVVMASRSVPAAILGCLVLVAYLAVTTVLLVRGLGAGGATRFGAANVVTAVRSSLVGVCTSIVVVSFVADVSVVALVALVVIALFLDGVDGWVARRTNSSSELGARFDMEVDAFLLLVLSVYASRDLGAWVLAIGLMRYAFVAAAWVLPWMNRRLPFRYWRKVVTAVQGIALAIAATGLLPGIDAIFVAVALALLVESFGRDVIWLAVRRGRADSAGSASAQHENRGDGEHDDSHGLDHEGLWNEGEAPRLRNPE